MKKHATRMISLFSILFLLLLGCQANEEESKATGFSSERESFQSSFMNQEEAYKVKEKLQELAEVDEAYVVALADDIFVSLSVSGHHRFFLKRIREDVHHITKEMSQAKKIHVTTDRKVNMELEKLQNKITNGATTKKEVEKKLKKIEKDMKG